MTRETTVRLPDACPQTVAYWANRFGEEINENRVDFPGLDAVSALVEELYPHKFGVEATHVVTLDGVLGVLLEYEFDDGYRPSPAVAAHWRIQAPEGTRFLCYSGCGSFNDCWQFAAFVPAEGATRALVEQCGQLLEAWGPRA